MSPDGSDDPLDAAAPPGHPVSPAPRENDAAHPRAGQLAASEPPRGLGPPWLRGLLAMPLAVLLSVPFTLAALPVALLLAPPLGLLEGRLHVGRDLTPPILEHQRHDPDGPCLEHIGIP